MPLHQLEFYTYREEFEEAEASREASPTRKTESKLVLERGTSAAAGRVDAARAGDSGERKKAGVLEEKEEEMGNRVLGSGLSLGVFGCGNYRVLIFTPVIILSPPNQTTSPK
ncbi:hypothetical protein ACJRO7_006376 [Eucalyptus globulus]|uniref:Uncharacterized protein n=1 Tax=Eucalyptus globulus TaxID=34317 RepID=A0ABD3IN47_EUCGL